MLKIRPLASSLLLALYGTGALAQGLGMSDLTDIERIEVLQGPQGTLYGKNTNAGAISVFTKRPSFEGFEGYIEGTLGNYNMGSLTLAATGPLSDTLAYRLSGNIHQRDGYMENSSAADGNDADDWNIQGKLLWEPNDRLSMMLGGSHVDRENTCCVPDATQGDAVQAELAKQGLPQDKNDPRNYAWIHSWVTISTTSLACSTTSRQPSGAMAPPR